MMLTDWLQDENRIPLEELVKRHGSNLETVFTLQIYFYRPPQSHLGRARRYPHVGEYTFPLFVLAVACTMCNKALRIVTRRYRTLRERYGALTERYGKYRFCPSLPFFLPPFSLLLWSRFWISLHCISTSFFLQLFAWVLWRYVATVHVQIMKHLRLPSASSPFTQHSTFKNPL